MSLPVEFPWGSPITWETRRENLSNIKCYLLVRKCNSHLDRSLISCCRCYCFCRANMQPQKGALIGVHQRGSIEETAMKQPWGARSLILVLFKDIMVDIFSKNHVQAANTGNILLTAKENVSSLYAQRTLSTSIKRKNCVFCSLTLQRND